MERKIAALFLFAFVCLQFALSPSSVSAQVDGGVLDLNQIIEEALGNNPELKGAQARADAYRERPAQAASLEDPRISLGVQNIATDDFDFNTIDMTMKMIEISQEVPLPGIRSLKKEAALHEAHAMDRKAKEMEFTLIKNRNRMQVPRFEKIVVNMGVGEANQNPKLLEAAVVELMQIAGQKPAVRRAKKSIANFKLREGQAIGCAVTLRGNRMWEFYDRLVNVALPRIRDFRGVPSKSFDGRGNYTLGLKEQINFPEIDYDKIMQLQGMDITFVTSARTDEESEELLALMNMPFRK